MKMTSREALICAAVSGWYGDGICPWYSPQISETILHWAKSSARELDSEDLYDAFKELVDDGLFTKVNYPIFAHPVYFCSYEEKFLEELENVANEVDLKFTLLEASILWESLAYDYDSDHGPLWRTWGMCFGQGYRRTYGPCLGPSCEYFKSGETTCKWGLDFRSVQGQELSDMSFLEDLEFEDLPREAKDMTLTLARDAAKTFRDLAPNSSRL